MINNVFTQFPKTYTGATVPGTITVFLGPGVLHNVVVNKALAATVLLQDNGTTFASLPVSLAAGSYLFDCDINKDLKVVTVATEYLTIMAGPV